MKARAILAKLLIAATIAASISACQKGPPSAIGKFAPDPVEARVNESPIFRSDVLREAPAATPGTPAFTEAVDQLVDQTLLGDESVKEGLDKTAAGRRRLAAARKRVLSDMLLEAKLRGAVSPESVAGLYQEMEKARPAGAPAEMLEQARPRIVRFLTYDRLKDLVLDLRHRAHIAVADQSQSGPAKP